MAWDGKWGISNRIEKETLTYSTDKCIPNGLQSMIHLCVCKYHLESLLIVLITGYFCVLLSGLGHELREVLFFGFRDGFGLSIRVSIYTPNRRRYEVRQFLTFILTTNDPPCTSIVLCMDSIARSKRSTAAYCNEQRTIKNNQLS